MSLAHKEENLEMELIDLARRKDSSAFDQLFHRHKPFVYNVCYRMLGSAEDAADAAQTAFIRAYKSLSGFRSNSVFRTWLYRIAINVCLEALRSRRRNERLMDKVEEPYPAAETDDRLWEAILMLPGNFRSVLVLFYFQQLSTQETAQALNCSESAVRTRLHRARAALKEIYEGIDT
ncbi:MAG: sigma-70 family RNA polymerase sigma factor [Armatimonadota bacterium]|nr:sigma-70 family RNA polymerase sigma factor [bacterium]